MSDSMAAVAREFIARYPDPVNADRDRVFYHFLAERYPKIELSPRTVERLAWSVAMLRSAQ